MSYDLQQGIIFKAVSGFYYVNNDTQSVRCKARGKFRKENITPLVGDKVAFSVQQNGDGIIQEILPRRNMFIRPPVANLDQMVIIASAVIPVTDPFLIDRIAMIAEYNNCEPVICINKTDINMAEHLYDTYSKAGFTTVRTSAVTMEGITILRDIIAGKVSVFTGNSGVGKSSILNALEPEFQIKVGSVSEKLGRGRHTTRHVELYSLSCGAVVADTPGFSSFDTEMMTMTDASLIQYSFRDFQPYLGTCKYRDCMHVKEDGCAVLQAVQQGKIANTRHASYVRLYEHAKQIKKWELKNLNI